MSPSSLPLLFKTDVRLPDSPFPVYLRPMIMFVRQSSLENALKLFPLRERALAAVYEQCNTRGCARPVRKSVALFVKRYRIDTRLIREMEKCRCNNDARATCSEIVQTYLSLSRAADGSQHPQMTSQLPRNPIHLVSESLNSCRYLLQSLPLWMNTSTVEQFLFYAHTHTHTHTHTRMHPFFSSILLPDYHGAARFDILYRDIL